MALKNGELPGSLLVAIPWDTSERLRVGAATALVALNRAFRKEFGHNLIINEGYRTYATQVRYYYNPPSGAGTAAKPGTSNHGWGMAVDIGGLGGKSGEKYKWMLANAPKFGWHNPLWARDNKGVEEPWHWEYEGAPDVQPDIIGSEEYMSRTEAMQGAGDFWSLAAGALDDKETHEDRTGRQYRNDVWTVLRPLIQAEVEKTLNANGKINTIHAKVDRYLDIKGSDVLARLHEQIDLLPERGARAVWGFKRLGDKFRGPDKIDMAQAFADVVAEITGKAMDVIKHPSERKNPTDF